MESRLNEEGTHHKAKVSSRWRPDVSAAIHPDNSCTRGLFSDVHGV